MASGPWYAKSNEIKAIPELLKVLDLKGCIITIDAMGCQKDMAKGIVAKKADYILAVKGNQERLHKAIQATFEQLDADPVALPHCTIETLETKRGRNEVRRVTTLNAVQLLPDDLLFAWPKLETLVRIQSAAQRGGKTVSEERFFICSLPMRHVEAIGQGIRSHWGIKNSK